jgi:hypothetical protein
MGNEKPQSTQSTMKLGLWLTFIAFLLVVFVFRTKISEISFGNQGVSAKMVNAEDVEKLSPQDRQAAEQDLSQRVSNLEQQARSNPQPGAEARPQPEAPTQPETPISDATYQQPAQQAPQAEQQMPQQQAAIPNIAGYWGASNGFNWQVNQIGNYVAIQAMQNGVVQAVATGQIWGSTFSLQSMTLLGHPGVLALEVSPDQHQLNGEYRDNYTGQVFPVNVSR